jgi:hypothetical protein
LLSDKEAYIEGQINAKTGNKIVYLPVFLKFIKGYKPFNGTIDVPIDSKTKESCSSQKGSICSSSQTCVGKSTPINGIPCCLGECKSSSNNGTGDTGGSGGVSGSTIGWIILVLILAVLFWFFFRKYKKTESSGGLLSFLKKKE